MKVEATPMMQQYLNIKKDYKDYILLYRMGDFYELFFDDAIDGSKILDITLTKRGMYNDMPIPMAGIPYHSLDNYLLKFIKHGVSIAICEQVSLPDGKGPVKREIARVITPGTITDEALLDAKSSNYLACFFIKENNYTVSSLDVSSSDFKVTSFKTKEEATNYLLKLAPAEIIIKAGSKLKSESKVTTLHPKDFDLDICKNNLLDHFNTKEIKNLNIKDNVGHIIACSVILTYAKDKLCCDMSHLDEISIKTDSANLQIDGYTLKNLELLSSLSGNKKTSFFSCIDNTKTPMGARLLKEWLLNPSINIDEIVKRQNATNTIIQMALFNKANDTLSQIGDMPRIASRIGTNTIRPRDLIALNQHLKQIPCLLNVFDNANDTYIQEILKTLNPMFDVVTLLENSINEEAGPVFKLGQVIKDKYDSKLDELRNLMHNQSNLLLEIEKREILATKINTLKVKFNKVQGYFIEISKAFAHLAPPHYHRMQTLKNVERYTIEELSRLFQITSTAKASALEIEKELFNEILEKLKGKLQSIYTNAKSIAIIDVLNSYAFLACNNNFVKPCFVKERKLEITKGEHYVVQTQEKDFVPNDCLLDEVHSSMLITGPNMGGKSTYMRQNALIVILAQMGSFVPARKVTLGLFDAVYTRIGASDDLAKGLSTYMVEMTETAYILKNCTKNSLVLIDEIGRGTSTYDGTALAYATLDYISNVKRAFTFFSTHYFELTKDIPKNCINMHFTAIKIPKGKLIFNHLIKPGPASESYGIEVASLAGVPEKVIQLACKKLKQLQQN